MTHVPFELDTIFAGDKSLLADLKVQDTHFARLIETYHTVNRAIHRIETNVEAASDAHLRPHLSSAWPCSTKRPRSSPARVRILHGLNDSGKFRERRNLPGSRGKTKLWRTFFFPSKSRLTFWRTRL
jgi:hypothetical protein